MEHRQYRRKQRSSSYRVKVIVAALLPVLLLMVVSSVYMSVTISTILQENFEKDIGLFVRQIDENFSNQLSTLYNLNMLLVSDQALTDQLSTPAPDAGTYEAARQRILVEERMENSAIVTTYSLTTVDNDSLLERFYLFRDGGTAFKAVFKNRGAYEQDYDRFFSSLYTSDSGGSAQMGMDNEVLWYTFDFADPDSDQTIGSLFYHLNEQALRVKPDSILDYEGAFWQLSTNNGDVLLSSNGDIEDHRGANTGGEITFQEVGTIDYLSSHYLIPQFGVTLSLFVPQAQVYHSVAASTLVYILILLALAVILLIICTVVVFRLTTPFKDLVKSIRNIEEGNLQAKLPYYHDMEFQELSRVFNSMTTKIDYLVNDVYEKQLLIAKSELKALQAQMNPHFMFNVLNCISIQAQMEHDEETSKMVYSFSQLLQASIMKTGEEKVTLAQELEYVNFYLYLQNHRFEERIEYEVNCATPELLQCHIPKLTLQPIVENAVVHGLEPKYGKGHLAVNIYSMQDDIYIDVLDDGVGFIPDEAALDKRTAETAGHKKIGLINSHKIIQHFYGLGYGISVVSSPGGGCRVTLHIPIDRGGTN